MLRPAEDALGRCRRRGVSPERPGRDAWASSTASTGMPQRGYRPFKKQTCTCKVVGVGITAPISVLSRDHSGKGPAQRPLHPDALARTAKSPDAACLSPTRSVCQPLWNGEVRSSSCRRRKRERPCVGGRFAAAPAPAGSSPRGSRIKHAVAPVTEGANA